MYRCETHCISRMMFRGGQVASLEQQQRQFLGGVEVIGLDCDEPLQQRQCRLLVTCTPADLIEDPEGTRKTGGYVQHVEASRLGRDGVAAGKRLGRTISKNI
jgi:hypothetical protein